MKKNKKVYLVIDTPHGDFGEVYGIFTTKEKADEVCAKYPQTLCTGPYTVEITLNIEKDWISHYGHL